MKLIKLPKNTPGSRHALILKKSVLFKNNNLIKKLKLQHHFNTGRSSTTGHITVWHKGAGCKQIYKKINEDTLNKCSLVIGMMYDCNRNNIVSLNFNLITKQFFYTTAIFNTYPGSLLICQKNIVELYLGYRSQLKNLPVGSLISNISHNKKSNSLIKAAGTFGQLIQKQSTFCKIRLPSLKIINLHNTIYATIGINANIYKKGEIVGKAGRNRLKNIRPTVRGIAMNPVDHPHGGRTNGGFHPTTPWGICTKGKKTKKKLK